ncbi:hypothetical protein FKP32DRAFT_1671597 [Trametes sanguinea]|nr:hypothetical protein FKP32DRAFT_1671597 [Trametes sanguinea]
MPPYSGDRSSNKAIAITRSAFHEGFGRNVAAIRQPKLGPITERPIHQLVADAAHLFTALDTASLRLVLERIIAGNDPKQGRRKPDILIMHNPRAPKSHPTMIRTVLEVKRPVDSDHVDEDEDDAKKQWRTKFLQNVADAYEQVADQARRVLQRNRNAEVAYVILITGFHFSVFSFERPRTTGPREAYTRIRNHPVFAQLQHIVKPLETEIEAWRSRVRYPGRLHTICEPWVADDNTVTPQFWNALVRCKPPHLREILQDAWVVDEAFKVDPPDIDMLEMAINVLNDCILSKIKGYVEDLHDFVTNKYKRNKQPQLKGEPEEEESDSGKDDPDYVSDIEMDAEQSSDEMDDTDAVNDFGEDLPSFRGPRPISSQRIRTFPEGGYDIDGPDTWEPPSELARFLEKGVPPISLELDFFEPLIIEYGENPAPPSTPAMRHASQSDPGDIQTPSTPAMHHDSQSDPDDIQTPLTPAMRHGSQSDPDDIQTHDSPMSREQSTDTYQDEPPPSGGSKRTSGGGTHLASGRRRQTDTLG